MIVVTASIRLPQRIVLRARASAILRSVLGHIVAAKTQDDQVPLDGKIRSYLADSEALDPSIKVYCWLYPFLPIVVARDFTFVVVRQNAEGSPGIVSVLKFFPLAFCVVDGRGGLNPEGLTTLHEFATRDTNDLIDLTVWRDPLLPPGWPERSQGDHVVLGGRTYIDSVTTLAVGGAKVSDGKRVQAEAWEGGDAARMFNGLHAFVEIPRE
jgi:hypothetical protein